LKLIVDMF